MSANENKMCFTEARLITEYGETSIRINKTDMNIHEIWEEILNPLLLGSGFNQEVIDKLFEDKPC